MKERARVGELCPEGTKVGLRIESVLLKDVSPALTVGSPARGEGSWQGAVELLDASLSQHGQLLTYASIDGTSVSWLPPEKAEPADVSCTLLRCAIQTDYHNIRYMVVDQEWEVHKIEEIALARGCRGMGMSEYPQYEWLIVLPDGWQIMALRCWKDTVKSMCARFGRPKPVEMPQNALNKAGFQA